MALYFGVGGVKKWKLYLKLKKKCLRVIMGVNSQVFCRKLFCELEILTLTSDVHSHNTIHKHNLYVQYCNTNRSKRSVVNMGIKLYNNLPIELKNVSEFKVFKKKLKCYLLNRSFYSLHEFLCKEGK
jgi:hypothetical protein